MPKLSLKGKQWLKGVHLFLPVAGWEQPWDYC